ncbi:ABC transporter substrate-binding protein [Streptomyces sp. VNUA24]|uniref:ABC transporter substrate-binding protein n=1 Tax=Streptomyces sp. VNUA24 TaxID=3031131 RepID=UPI0023B8775A|nr:ABC transporter substrate-binding protein [Streptomyces sp. VNUA24]WEH12858.1 ABC transporter substrate-binding protein [Streptomyces sp. VNUA24]
MFVVGTTGPATAATGPEPDRDWRISTDYDFDANPFSDQFGGPGFIMTEVFETLLSMDRHGAPDFAHSLATAYEVSKDGRHYTFHLRRGVRWSDGRPLTVQDVLYSWNEVGPESILFSRYLTNVDRAVAVDAHTVRIDMKRPDARIPSAFVYIVPRHIWEKVPKDKLATYDPCCSVVGSGPFTITRLDGNGTTVLEPNPYFYGPRGHIRRILLIKYGDKESQLRDLRAGSLDAMVEGESKWVGMLRGQDGVKVWNAPSPLNNVLVFNSCPPQGNDTCKAPGSHVDWKVVQDPAIRDALKWAIDRPNLLATAYRGVGGPGVSFIPPYYKPYGLWTDWSSDPEVGYRFDPDRARRVLADGGWTCPRGGTCRRDGVTAEFTLSVRSESAEDQNAAQRIVAWAGDVGIRIKLQYVTTDRLQEDIYATSSDDERFQPAYDAFMWNELGDPTTPDGLLDLLNCHSPTTDSYWCDPRFDRLADAALTEVDRAERVNLLRAADRMALADGPYIPLVHQNIIVLTRNDTWKGYEPVLGQPYFVAWSQLQHIVPAASARPEKRGLLLTVSAGGFLLLVAGGLAVRRRRRESTEPLEFEDGPGPRVRAAR